MAAGGPTNREVTVELVGWRNRRGRFTAATRQAKDRMRHGARRALEHLKALAEEESPVGKAERPDSERFKHNWRIQFRSTKDGGEGVLTNTASHAGLVIFPTDPHDIRPVRARVLRFEANGQIVYTRGPVRHPGTKGNDVPGRALERGRAELEGALGRITRQVQTDIVDVWK
jgi:hypothetical protein